MIPKVIEWQELMKIKLEENHLQLETRMRTASRIKQFKDKSHRVLFFFCDDMVTPQSINNTN